MPRALRSAVRLDKFLQLSQLVKRRTLAHALCEAGRVRLNGVEAKPAASVSRGDVITVTHGDRRVMAKVLAVPTGPRARGEWVEILGRITLRDLPNPQAPPGGLRDDRD